MSQSHNKIKWRHRFVTFPASSVALWRKIDARMLYIMGLLIKLSSGAMLLFYSRLVRISLHQANFSPYNIVHKIDDRKAYCFIFRLIYTLPGIEISMGKKLTSETDNAFVLRHVTQ